MNATINGDKVPVYHPILCAWCDKEGRRTVTGYTTIIGSTGICDRHNREMRREAGLDDD